jgi:hypothetical protein
VICPQKVDPSGSMISAATGIQKEQKNMLSIAEQGPSHYDAEVNELMYLYCTPLIRVSFPSSPVVPAFLSAPAFPFPSRKESSPF